MKTSDNVDLRYRIEPDPLDVLRIVQTDPGPYPADIKESAALRDTLPYFYRLFDDLVENWSDCSWLFAGRDARIFYLFCKVVSSLRRSDDPRITQIPGSRVFYRKRKDSIGKDDAELLNTFGITRKALDEGSRFVFIDTGFEGTLGIEFRSYVQKALGPVSDVVRSIPILLVSSYAKDPTISALNDLGPATGIMHDELQAYIRHKTERGITQWGYVSSFSRVNDYLAVLMQNVPQYHGAYSDIVRTSGGVRIDVMPSDSCTSRPIYEINPDFVDPDIAFTVDRSFIRDICAVEKVK